LLVSKNNFFRFYYTSLLLGAYEYLTKKSNGRNTDVSRLFIYYNARVKGDNSGTIVDSGCSMTDAIEALEEFGVCLESIWPYDISQVNTRPNNQAYDQAVNHKINEALQVNIDLDEMKSCLAQGFPFAFGLKLYSSFDKAAHTGVVPMPNAGDGNRQSDGRFF
jgi:C1A family cysteine protease